MSGRKFYFKGQNWDKTVDWYFCVRPTFYNLSVFLFQEFVEDPESDDAVDVSIVRVLEQMGCRFEKVGFSQL